MEEFSNTRVFIYLHVYFAKLVTVLYFVHHHLQFEIIIPQFQIDTITYEEEPPFIKPTPTTLSLLGNETFHVRLSHDKVMSKLCLSLHRH